MTKGTTIDELAVMVKNGFDSMETRIGSIESNISTIKSSMATKQDLKDLKQDLTKTIYTEIGKANLRLDNVALKNEVNSLDKRVTKLEKHLN